MNVVHVSQDSYDDLIAWINDTMADHVMQGRVLSSDLTDNLLLRSALLQDDRRVRINRFNYARRQQVRQRKLNARVVLR
jgi:hypothetical protein